MDQVVRYTEIDDMLRLMAPSDPVLCLRPELIRARAARFLDLFPGRVLYAMKCNPHALVLDALHQAGITDFDTASISEMQAVRERFHGAGCYFHHPVKSRGAIARAYEEFAVRHFVVDDEAELAKLKDVLPRPGVVVQARIATPGTQAAIDLSSKFGAPPESAVALLCDIAAAGFAAGITFHVGSQCLTPEAFTRALALSGGVMQAANVTISNLNVGGGFPIDYPGLAGPPLEAYFAAIRDGISSLNLGPDCQLICEPGRALVADAGSLVVQVQMRKGQKLYINDGIYGALMDLRLTPGLNPPVRLCRPAGEVPFGDMRDFTIFGPTCDALDVLPLPWRLPADVGEGDWIEVAQMGAYSTVFTTNFNGLQRESVVELVDRPLRVIAA